MTTRHVATMTWADIASLPEAPERAKMALPDRNSRPLESLWEAFGKGDSQISGLRYVKTARRLTSPAAVRLALGLTQPEMGRVLGVYLGRHSIAGGTVAMYEWWFRSKRAPSRYAPTPHIVAAYRHVVADAVAMASSGRLSVRSRMSRRHWSFDLMDVCACGRKYAKQRTDQKRCPKCIRKVK